MNSSLRIASSLIVTALVVATGCSSKTPAATTRKAATGAPAATTTKPPATTAKPSKKGGSNVTTNTGSAVVVEQVTCDASEEGLAVCVDTYAIFCAGGKAYGLDCALAYAGATCGDPGDGTIDCVIAE